MVFSEFTQKLAKQNNITPKEVFFAILTAAGCEPYEVIAVTHSPNISTKGKLQEAAEKLMRDNSGITKLQKALNAQWEHVENTRQRIKTTSGKDYTSKEVVLQELGEIVRGSNKDSDRLSALKSISDLLRLREEQDKDTGKLVTYYIPIDYNKADELHRLLKEWNKEGRVKKGVK